MRRSTAVLVWVLTLATSAAAQEFPSKPVKLVVPFPPGGPLDISGRLIGKELQDRWGQPVINSFPISRPEMSSGDRKSTRLNSSHGYISYAVFCLKKKKHHE